MNCRGLARFSVQKVGALRAMHPWSVWLFSSSRIDLGTSLHVEKGRTHLLPGGGYSTYGGDRMASGTWHSCYIGFAYNSEIVRHSMRTGRTSSISLNLRLTWPQIPSSINTADGCTRWVIYAAPAFKHFSRLPPRLMSELKTIHETWAEARSTMRCATTLRPGYDEMGVRRSLWSFSGGCCLSYEPTRVGRPW